MVRELPLGSIPNDALFSGAWHVHDPEGSLAEQEVYAPGGKLERPWMTAGVDDDIQALAAAGAAGVLYLRDLDAEDAQDMWVQTALLGTPAGVLAGAHAGELRDALLADVSLDLQLRIEGARDESMVARSLYVDLEGPTDESPVIVVQTHTDILNPLQENGALGLLALARHYAALPRGERPAALRFELSAGHRNQVVGAAAARDDAIALGDRLRAVLCVEHLGALELLPVAAGDEPPALVETGYLEPTAISFPAGATAVAEALLQRVAERGLDRVLMLEGAGFFGESKVFVGAGLPTYEMIAGPWVQNSPGVGAEVVDLEDMQRKITLMADWIEIIADAG